MLFSRDDNVLERFTRERGEAGSVGVVEVQDAEGLVAVFGDEVSEWTRERLLALSGPEPPAGPSR